jgi:hypothetical protein
MSTPYENAYVVLAHGADRGRPRRLPEGVCVVTFMQCGALADVFGQVDAAHHLFKNQRIRDVLLNPGNPENKKILEKTLFGSTSPYQITIAEGPHDTINDYSFSLMLSSPNDDNEDEGWLVKSGLYKYPISSAAGAFTISENLDMNKITRDDVAPAYKESLYPTQGDMNGLMIGKRYFEFFNLQDDLIVPNYPLSIWDIINDTKGLGTRGASGDERIVIFNPVCRDFAQGRYQMRKSTIQKTIALHRAASGEKQQERKRRGLSFTNLRAVREENEVNHNVGELEELHNVRRRARKPSQKAAAANNSNNNSATRKGCAGRTWNAITSCLKRMLTARQKKMIKFVKVHGGTRKNRR